MNRPSKRQRKENPRCWLHNHSLACVASPSVDQPIQTKVASTNTKRVFLERLEKEIVQPFHLFRGKKPTRERLKDKAPATESVPVAQQATIKRTWPKQIIIGTNQCTRVLEKAARVETKTDQNGTVANGGKPILIVLARDIYPPTMLSHVPVLAERIRQSSSSSEKDDGKNSSSLLLLPGRASKEMGKMFGPKHVSILVFLETEGSGTKEEGAVGKESDAAQAQQEKQLIASFVKFVTKNLLP